MDKPTLFMLAPGFNDRNRPEFCPECAELWGVLSYFPAIKSAIEIQYVPIVRPRLMMTDLLGAAHQNAPTLVFSKGLALPAGIQTQISNGHVFIDNAKDIAVYFALKYSTPYPRGYHPTS